MRIMLGLFGLFQIFSFALCDITYDTTIDYYNSDYARFNSVFGQGYNGGSLNMSKIKCFDLCHKNSNCQSMIWVYTNSYSNCNLIGFNGNFENPNTYGGSVANAKSFNYYKRVVASSGARKNTGFGATRNSTTGLIPDSPSTCIGESCVCGTQVINSNGDGCINGAIPGSTANGSSCKQDADCTTGNFCSVSNKCSTIARSIKNGDACTQDRDCSSASACANSICRPEIDYSNCSNRETRCEPCPEGYALNSFGVACIPLVIIHATLPVVITSTVKVTTSVGTLTSISVATPTPVACSIPKILIYDASCCPDKYLDGLVPAKRPSNQKRATSSTASVAPGTTTRTVSDISSFRTVTTTLFTTVPATATTKTSTAATASYTCLASIKQICQSDTLQYAVIRNINSLILQSYRNYVDTLSIDCGEKGYFTYNVNKS